MSRTYNLLLLFKDNFLNRILRIIYIEKDVLFYFKHIKKRKKFHRRKYVGIVIVAIDAVIEIVKIKFQFSKELHSFLLCNCKEEIDSNPIEEYNQEQQKYRKVMIYSEHKVD